MPLLSVIVPVYNESKTVKQIIEKINLVPIDKEIIVVDDGSTDGTDKILRDVRIDNLKVIHHSANRGKGAAFLTGFSNATGEFVIIQDGDLEYDPQDYLKLIEEIKKEGVDAVVGARFTAKYHGMLIPQLGNRFLTGLLNLLYRSRLNDCLCCYKLFRRETLASLNIRSCGFEIDTEILAKALKRKIRISQVPVTYAPRSYAEGKKIRIRDGIRYAINIIKNRF